MRHTIAVFTLCGLFVVAASSSHLASDGQSPPGTPNHPQVSSYYPREVFAARRKALAARLGEGVALIPGAQKPAAYTRFRQSNTFFYLTGLEVPDALLWIDGTTGRSTLFLPDGATTITADGPRLIPNEEAIALTGVDNVTGRQWLYMSLAARLPTVIHTLASPEEVGATSRDGAQASQSARFNDPWDDRVPREAAFIGRLRQHFPTVPIRDLTPVVDEMRWVKDAAEIRALREAGRIGVEGYVEAIKTSRPGIAEHELADVARYVFMRRGATGEAYFPVVASGPNSVYTHYSNNRRTMEPGDIVVMDYAPDYQYMVVDITRTWPVSGRFTDEQVRYYSTVLEAHKALIDAVVPGVTVKQLVALARSIYEKHGMTRYFPGGIGHFVGMSAHDPGAYDRPLVPGVVFNVEPMLGVEEKGWHFRLEDTVLVTSAGHEVLTAGLPWELEDLYKLRDAGSSLELSPRAGSQAGSR